MITSRVYQKTELYVFLCQIWISLKICDVPVCTLLHHVGWDLNRHRGQEETWNKYSLQLKHSLRLHDSLIKETMWMLGLILWNYMNVFFFFYCSFLFQIEKYVQKSIFCFINVTWLTTYASIMQTSSWISGANDASVQEPITSRYLTSPSHGTVFLIVFKET